MIPYKVRFLGKVDYPSVLAKQEEIISKLVAKTKKVTQIHFEASKKAVAEKSPAKPQMLPIHDAETPIEILVVEHTPGAYTMGKRDTTKEGLRFPFAKTETEKEQMQSEFKKNLFHLKRGGGLTYHGPGQLTVYPILHIPSLFKIAPDETKSPKQGALHWYTGILEKTMMKTLKEVFGIKRSFPGNTGVWIPEDHQSDSDDTNNFTPPPSRTEAPPNASKIGFIGLDFRQNCVMHGLALNMTKKSIEPFGNIVICEMENAKTTCVEECMSSMSSGENQDHQKESFLKSLEKDGMKESGFNLVRHFEELTGLKTKGSAEYFY